MLYETIARGWENLVGRLGGPMSFRFLMQPAVAIFFAIRAGVRDARRKQADVSGVCTLESEFVAGADATVLEGRGDSLYRRADLGRDLPGRRAFWNLRVGIADHGDRLGAGAVHGLARSCRARREMGWGRETCRSFDNKRQRITNRKLNNTSPRKAHEHVNRLETRLDQTRGDGDSRRRFRQGPAQSRVAMAQSFPRRRRAMDSRSSRS